MSQAQKGMERLAKAVERAEGLLESGRVFVLGVAERIRDLFPDNQKADELAAALEVRADAFARALAANPLPAVEGEPEPTTSEAEGTGTVNEDAAESDTVTEPTGNPDAAGAGVNVGAEPVADNAGPEGSVDNGTGEPI